MTLANTDKKHVNFAKITLLNLSNQPFFIADINVIANDDKYAKNSRKHGTEYVYFAWVSLFWRILYID